MNEQIKFKDTEIGMIPEDWDVKYLGDVSSKIVDCSHARKPEFIDKSELIFLEVSNIGEDGFLDLSERKFINKSDFDAWTKRLLPKYQDVILTKTGRVGAAAQIPENIKCCIGRNQVIVRANRDILDLNFLLAYFMSPNFRRELSRLELSGTILQSLHVKYFPNIRVPFPSLEEQRGIGKQFMDISKKAKLLQKQNKTLEAIGQAIFKHWFVDFEFPNEEGKPYKSSGGEMVDSELGGIPKGWEVKVILEVADVVDCLHRKKPNQSELGKLLLQVYNIGPHGLLDLNKKFFVSDEDYNLWTKNIELKEGDCLLTNAGLTGAIAQVPFGFTAGIGRNITAVRAKLISPYYLVTYLFSKYGQEEIEKNIDHGTIFNSLNVKGIRKIKLLIPENSIMDKFNKIIKPLRKLMENNLYEEYTLSQIRDSLLPKLMSGKIRVPVEVE